MQATTHTERTPLDANEVDRLVAAFAEAERLRAQDDEWAGLMDTPEMLGAATHQGARS